MNLNEAIQDPKRPLSITPKEWMMSVEANLAEEEELTKNTAKRIYAAKKKDDAPKQKDYMISGIETIDMGIDQMVQGAKLTYSGFDDTKKADLRPNIREAVEKIKELMETAIIPYLKDITELSDQFEDDGEE